MEWRLRKCTQFNFFYETSFDDYSQPTVANNVLGYSEHGIHTVLVAKNKASYFENVNVRDNSVKPLPKRYE